MVGLQFTNYPQKPLRYGRKDTVQVLITSFLPIHNGCAWYVQLSMKGTGKSKLTSLDCDVDGVGIFNRAAVLIGENESITCTQ